MDMSPDFKAAFAALPAAQRPDFEALRGMIHDLARADPATGAVVEEVKWGQPSFATRPKTGTPLRLGMAKSGRMAVFVHCQTDLIGALAPHLRHLIVDGNRAVEFAGLGVAERAELRQVIGAALRYHLR